MRFFISFNHEDIHRYLESYWSIIHMKYSLLELQSKFIIRVCCAHVMHAFVRSLHKMKLKRDERQSCAKLFAVLININIAKIFEFDDCLYLQHINSVDYQV